MKGYLSRIVQQSGLRYQAKSVGPAASPVSDRPRDPAPLEREESVLVPPSGIPESAEAAHERDGKDRLRTARHQADVRPAEERQEPSVSREVPVPVASREGGHPVSNEIRPVTARAESAAGSSSAKAMVSGSHEDGSSGRGAVAPRVSEESASPDAAVAGVRHAGDEDSVAKADGPSTGVSSLPDAANREFFVRTARILDKGDAGTQDAQSIVLQEVHEWVASSPEEAGAEQAPAPEPEVLQAEVRPWAMRQETVQQERTAQAAPVEQRFELSIGTISVIVEEAERPRPPEPPARRPATAVARENEPRSSRLGRSYL